MVPNPHQPRHHMDDAGLAELAASIREHGVLQPVLVTETLDGYQLIAGERRVRAARLAGLERIPALVRQLADRDQLEVALVENVQRADLDPIDEALAYRQLIDEFGLTQERVADRVGKARATVANTLRLLDLHPDVQAAIGDGRITEGHGRALGGLPLDGQAQVLGTVVGQGLSVRQTEELVRRLREPRPVREPAAEAAPGRRPGAGRGGPPPAAGDQGEPQPVAQGRPHRDRVLQRRGARAALRSPDRRNCVTDVGDRQRPAEANGRAAGGRKTKAAPGSDYGASSIQVLEGLEAVRRRPGMYIGSTDARGLHHLVWEVVDNSIDEAMAGHATTVLVTIHAGRQGRRSRTTAAACRSGRHSTGKDALEVVHTVLHAGGKFGGGGYKVSGGLHGVGVSVVNALSVLAPRRDRARRRRLGPGVRARQAHHQGREDRARRGRRKGTRTIFQADAEMFETMDYSFDTISQRLRESAYLTKGVWITLRDERNERERSFYFEGGLVSFVRHLNRNKEALHNRPIYCERRDGSTTVEVALQYNDSYAENVLAFANNINTVDGGTHITGFRRALTRSLNDWAKRAGVLKESDAQPLRRRRPRGPDRRRERQAHRAPVRGPDEGQARQRRGRGPGRGRGGGRHQPVPRGEPGRRPPDHREVPDVRAGPRRRPQGARPGHPQGRAGRHVASRASSPTARSATPPRASSTSSRATRPAAPPSRAATAASRRSCRCAASSSTSRRRAWTGS